MNTITRPHLLFLLAAVICPVCAMDGFSVTVQRKGSESLLLKCTIEGTAVARIDTLYRDACYYHPVISPDGQYIGFVSGDHISVMNSDGFDVRHLVPQNEFMAWYDRRNNVLEWPAGHFLYYRKSETEIWKIDATNPGDHSRAFTYQTMVQNDREVAFRKWSASLALHRGAVQLNMCNNVHPLSASDVVAEYTCDPQGCNIHISPSGAFLNWFTGTPHDYVELGSWDGSPETSYLGRVMLERLSELAGAELGSGMDWPSWSANSDKWMCLQVGLSDSGCMGGRWLKCGANQVLYNWIDETAIRTTANTGGGPIACCGDLWVRPNDGGGVMLQDTAGQWLTVTPGASAGHPRERSTAPDHGHIRVQAGPTAVCATSETGPVQLMLRSLRGSTIVTAVNRVSIHGLPHGLYLLSARSADGRETHRRIVHRGP